MKFGADRKDASQQYLPAMRTNDSDWVHQAIEVTAGEASVCSVRFLLGAITGDVWVEDISYEEIKE